MLVEDVIDALKRLGPVDVSVLPGREENIEFRLPAELGARSRNTTNRNQEEWLFPFLREIRIGAYLLKQKLLGRKRYPLVLMLEPLFRCNLACVGCGKIDYPDESSIGACRPQECLEAVDECGAPMVAIPGGEPLHPQGDRRDRQRHHRAQEVSSTLCTNALLLEKKLHLFEPSPYLFFSVHLDGLKEHHDKSVCQEGVFDRAVAAIKAAKAEGFASTSTATLFDGAEPAEDIAKLPRS